VTVLDAGIGPATTRERPAVRIWERHPVLFIWSGWAIFLLLLSRAAMVHFQTQEDDYLRLMEVRDLLAGQSWFDIHQYRMDPPHGAAMHWSRLVDVPIALALLLSRLVLPEPAASIAAMTIVPLAQLLLAMVLVARLMRELTADRAVVLLAAALVPLSPLVLTSFVPMRIDHHGWQAIAALACALLLVRPGPKNALAGGAIAALWLTISMEGFPLVALLAAIYGTRFAFRRETELVPFLAGLAGVSLLAFAATRAVADWAVPYCDSLTWPHMAGFTLAAVLCAGLIRLPLRTPARLAALAAIGLGVAAVVIAPLGICAISPFAKLDPVMRTYWYDAIKEGLPISRQSLSAQAMLVWPALILGYAAATGLLRSGDVLADRKRLLLGAYALAATGVSFLVMRGGINAQLLTVPFSALIVIRAYPRIAAMGNALGRALATVLLLTLATPILASAALKPFDGEDVADHRERLKQVVGTDGDCDMAALGKLAPAHIFATTDLGPRVLVFTVHSVVTGGYHRNMAKMREVTEAFSGDPARAEALVRANRAAYVMLCATAGDTAVYRTRRPDNLANALTAGRIPVWLEPVPGLTRDALGVWRVRP
jgi:hypothetical protein